MDPSIVGANLGGPVAIAVITSYLKPFIEQRWKPNDPLHDTIIRIVALVLGLVGYVSNYAGSASPVTFMGLENAAGAGFLAAAGAVVTYHLVTSATPSATATLSTVTGSLPIPMTLGLSSPITSADLHDISTVGPLRGTITVTEPLSQAEPAVSVAPAKLPIG